MAYGDHLRRLLAPLGVYDLRAESVSGAMIDAVGDALDGVWQTMREALDGAFPATAASDALARLEQALPEHGSDPDPEVRRAGILRLLGQPEVCCAKVQLESALAACGIPATLTLSGGTVTVHTALTETAARTALARALLPAHLDMDWQTE